MLSFINWLIESPIKYKRKKKNERSNSQTSFQDGTINQQGEIDRFNQEIPTTIIHYFAEPE
jgi:hypothetical protein